MNIAIFGGSFNPVHFGHYEIVRYANLQFEFAKIIVVPVYKNPLKDGLPSIPQQVRLDMLQATFSNIKNVEISCYELNKQKTSFTHNTLEHFREQFPNHQFYLILGEDAFASFHLWAKADRITELCQLITFQRPASRKSSYTIERNRLSDKVSWVEARIPDISATEIRKSPLESVKQNHWLHPEAFKIWEQFIKSACTK